MSKERLNYLSIPCIENDIIKQLSIEEAVEEYSAGCSRKEWARLEKSRKRARGEGRSTKVWGKETHQDKNAAAAAEEQVGSNSVFHHL